MSLTNNTLVSTRPVLFVIPRTTKGAMTDPEPESSAKRTGDSLLSRSLLNPAAPRLKRASDDAPDANEKKMIYFALDTVSARQLQYNKSRKFPSCRKSRSKTWREIFLQGVSLSFHFSFVRFRFGVSFSPHSISFVFSGKPILKILRARVSLTKNQFRTFLQGGLFTAFADLSDTNDRFKKAR